MTLQESLIRLNQLDLRVRGLSSRFESAARRHHALKTRAQQKHQQVQELTDQLKHKQAHQANLEREIGDLDGKIDEHREQMNAVTDHKVYQALTAEVKTLKDRKSQLETEAIESMTDVEEDQRRLETLQAELAEQEKLATGAQEEVDAAKAEVADKLEEARAEFEQAKAEVPDRALETYLKLSEIHEGEALGTVTIQSFKHHEYVCSASQMVLPIDTVNRLITNPDELVIDSMSNTILVLHESVAERLAGTKK